MSTLVVRGLSASYRHRSVLSGVNIGTSAGRITGILGRVHSGRTTFFHSLLGLVRASEGEVRIDNTVIDRRDRWKFFSYLPKDEMLPSDLTLAQVVRLFIRDEEIRDALFTNRHLASHLYRHLDEMTKDWRRFIQLILVLATGRSFALLDEPLVTLDPEVSALVIDEIHKHRPSSGIFVSDYDEERLSKLCDEVYVLTEKTLSRTDCTVKHLREVGYLPPRPALLWERRAGTTAQG